MVYVIALSRMTNVQMLCFGALAPSNSLCISKSQKFYSSILCGSGDYKFDVKRIERKKCLRRLYEPAAKAILNAQH